MSRIKFIVTKLVFAICFVLLSNIAFATDDPEIVRIFSSAPAPSGVTYFPLAANVNDELVDDIYYNNFSSILNPNNDKITNVISLLVREADIAKIKTDFTATVNVQIDYTLVNGSTGSIPNTALTLNYTIAAGLKYNARQTLKFDQCRKVKITILSISNNNYNWNIWEVINLENRMLRKRDYNFDYTNAVLIPYHDPATALNADELLVNWSANPLVANGKTHVDVEWTWIDAEAYANYQNSSAQFDADLLFKNNASRITVDRSKSSYKIPLIYDGAGRLFYRIRPVQLRENEQVINGEWSAISVTGITYYERNLGQGHQENLNWQTTTSFAEEGKRKTVVQYFDGTLRGRQTVTKDNVSNLTVVAESFYDFQGRPTINILPAPTMNSIIKYTADFNKFVGGFVTPKEAFDLMPTNVDVCNYQTPRLDKNNPNGGAAQYYSDKNPEKLVGFNKFIPDADGYAFTETRYTPDATGRIEAQGGVGGTFQLGKGNGINDHDTKYFYGKPDQKELDALFGTEVGDATHYSKNMVRDANGQYSVSYVDMHGRTIATALAGKSPDNVKPLQSYAGTTQNFEKDLITPTNNIVEGRSIVASTTLLVTQNVEHKFHYELSPLSAEIIACNPNGQKVCYDCYYNLEIRITGGCGVNIVKTANNLSFNSGTPIYDISCNTLPAPIIFEFTELLKEGEYNITKTLTVNKDAQDWYRDNVYNKKNNCKTFQYFYDLIYDEMMLESSECNICEDCNVREQAAFKTKNIVSKSGLLNGPAYNLLKSTFNLVPPQKSNVITQPVKLDENNLAEEQRLTTSNNSFSSSPINDHCKNAIDLTVNPDYNCENVLTNQTTYGASSSGTSSLSIDPAYSPSCFPSQFPYINNMPDVWYKFLATGSEHRVIVDVLVGKVPPAVIVTIYSGECRLSSIEIACKKEGAYLFNLTGLTAGNYYRVRVGSYGGPPCYFNICIGTPPPTICPPNAPATCTSVCDQPKNVLGGIRDLMMDDMTPDQGQYARLNFDLNENGIDDAGYSPEFDRFEISETMAFNIFNPSIGYLYKLPINPSGGPVGYADEDGNPDPDGTITAINGLNPDQFNERFKPSWAAQLLPYHPEYCKLLKAETSLAESYRRDAIIEETNTWQDAYNAGYIETINPTIGTSGTGILDLDPFFNCVGSNKKILMAQYIDSNFNAYPLPTPYPLPPTTQPILSLWKIAWMSVFCADNSVPMPSTDCYTSAPIKPNDFLNATPDFANRCEEDKNAVWRIFRTLYLSEKERMVNEWLQSECATDYTNIDGAAGNHYERRFGKPSEYYTSANYLQNLINQVNTNPTTAAAEPLIQAEYDDNCKSYKAAWASKLRRCPTIKSLDEAEITNPLTGVVRVPNPFIDELLIDLVNICYYGSDDKHQMGSSTLPGGIGINETDMNDPLTGIIYIPASFQEAFVNRWNILFPPPPSGSSQTVFCNQDLIDFPQPYNHQSPVANESIDEQKDECVCARLKELIEEKSNDVKFNNYNTQPSTLSQYILYKHGTTVRQTLLESLTINCDPKKECNNYAFAVEIPAILSCDNRLKNCVECEEFQTLLAEFQTKYSPLSDNVIYQNPANDDEIAANKALAGFLNNKTGLTKSWAEYLDFKSQCDLLRTIKCSKDCHHPIICQDVMFPDYEEKDSCNQYVKTLALNAAIEQYQVYLLNQKDIFENTYLNKCLEAKDKEIFTVEALHAAGDPPAEYHYTLYYYDQAGNLVKTIPPEGVRPNFNPGFLANIKAQRAAGVDLPSMPHFLPTQYRYNTLNQVVQQKSPDGGLSKFWYDELGRLVVSQNEKQGSRSFFNSQKKYSYTKYDVLGRITEVGEKQRATTAMTQDIAQGLNLSMPLATWLTPQGGSLAHKQITKTIYDQPYTPLCTNNLLCQQNMRNRVSYSYVQAFDDGGAGANTGDPINDAPWESATFYTYDIHGNVDVLLQDYKKTMGLIAGNRFKKITYKYDLISGKVNEVAYQPEQADAFYHRYQYDAENKLTEVYTSKEYVYWETDAKYDYYRHGPLARTTLGHLEVQGVDYAYTLQGWLKGVNTTSLKRPSIIGNGEDCGENSAVDNLYVYNRPIYTPYYKARISINFMPSTFQSLIPDNFETFLDPSLTSCTTDGNAGDEVYDYTNDGKYDMGQDGQTNASGVFVPNNNSVNYNGGSFTYGRNTKVPDAYGFSLNYFNGDYTRINTDANNPFATINMRIPTNDAANPFSAEQLFNGNIGAMAVSIPKLGKANVYGYNYDQLNRITNMQVFNGVSGATNTFTPVAVSDYKEAVTYDANGNIKTYLRNGHNNPTQNGPPHLDMDKLTYKYELDANGMPKSNKLRYVHDQVADANYAEDIDSQTANSLAELAIDNPVGGGFAANDNYAYDAIGNLIKDTKEGIQGIVWTVYGKISSISKLKDGLTTVINYTYDASGNRISKTLRKEGKSDVTTFYVRDASGNVMSVYDNQNLKAQLFQKEIHIYGSSRLAVYNVDVNVQAVGQSRIFIPMAGVTNNEAELFTFTRGNKFFELSNHLGNVLVTISDKKLAVASTIDPNLIAYYNADVVTASDYYPYGMQMPGRKYLQPNSSYRYGFNGQMKSDEIGGDSYTAQFWEYDARTGRRWNVEPLIANYPNLSGYATFGNNPINAVDPDGKRFYFVGGAGNDKDGWNYISRFKSIFSKKGINNFVRIDASGGKAADIAFTTSFRNFGGFTGEQTVQKPNGTVEIQLTRREHKQITKAVNDIMADLAKYPLKDGEQLNLGGYSYGSVLQAQVALRLADKGVKVNNLILIGSPISDQSPLYKEITDNPKIGKVIRNDIVGDKLSNPKTEGQYIQGGVQNSNDNGPHFDLARPGPEADKKIEAVADKLKTSGIK